MNSKEQENVLEKVLEDKNVFFTGIAGTGKTYLIDIIYKSLISSNKSVYKTSTTGVSAFRIKGTTIDNFAGTGTGKLDIEEYKKKPKRSIRDADVLIIDEISMMSKQKMDMLNELFQHARKSKELFGGIQVVFCGDFYQLKPVEGDYCFLSEAFKKLDCYIELNTVYRQKDIEWIKILSEIRDGKLSNDSIKEIEKRKKVPDCEDYITIYSTNKEVEQVNVREIKKLSGDLYTYKAKEIIKGSLKYDYRVDKKISMKKDAKVMLTDNLNVDDGLVNGAIGTVKDFTKEGLPIVSFSKVTKAISRTFHEIEENGKTIAKIHQLPLKLAYAITIHKSQGSQFGKIRGNPSKIFDSPQAYVFFSRCTDLSGIYLDDFNANRIKPPSNEVLEYKQRFDKVKLTIK